MSKTAAVTVSHCRLHSGGLGAVLAILVLLPSATLAANPEPALRRSDQVDVRRLGKVSEDERSVLRIEWRAGLAGAEETRSVQDMLDKLGRLEAGISDVSNLVRNMPAQAPAVAVANPVVPAIPAAAAPDASGYDPRLVVANLAAVSLVALWWFRRRRTSATQPETVPAFSQEDAPPGIALRTENPPAADSPVTAFGTPPEAEAASADATVAAPEAEAPSSFAAAALPEAVAQAEARPGDDAARTQPAEPPDLAPLETAEPVATTISDAPETKPAEAFNADQTMIFDFSLEEADPEVVERENAKLLALRPASPPEAPPTPPAAQKTDLEPTLQLAEIMLSMGLEQGAAQALIEYTEANPRHAIYHWLKLLGIYRGRGMQKEFAVTAEKLRLYFNIQAAEWGTPVMSEAPTLENFSRVSEHVQKIWSQPEECITYLRHLLEDNREGARAGFPQSVAEEILLLVEILKAEQA
jgi:hypothetical protein